MSDRDRMPPPPVEPLADLAWARVERAVLAELDTPETRQVHVGSWKWPAFAIGGTLAAAAVIGLLVLGEDPVGTQRTPRAGATAELSASRVVTADAPTDVTYGDAHVTVAAGSAIVLDGSADRGVLAVLERGSASFAVAPRRGRPVFAVQAGEVGVRVVGTMFTVTRTGDDASVEVAEGTVEVLHRGRRVEVRAGHSWTSVKKQVAAAPARTTPAPAPAAPAAPATTIAPDAPAATPPAPAPAPARITTDRGSAPKRGEPTSHVPAPGRPATSGESDQARFEAAARLEASNPADAIARYRELARGKGAWAGNALYALGRLSFDRGDHATASASLRTYLKRFPRGANAADARALLAKLAGE